MSKTTTLNQLFKLSSKNKSVSRADSLARGSGDRNPSELVIASILNYSKALSIRDNNLLGKLELILN